MKTDDICEKYSVSCAELNIKLIRDDDDDLPTQVLIQAPARGLRMLAELLMAVADGNEDNGFSISPFGAGSFHFAQTSELGIYFYRQSNVDARA